MISKFDSLYESLLTELMPMSFEDYGAVQSIIDTITDNIMASKGNSGHWSKAFTSPKLKKVPDERLKDLVKGMVTDVVHELFPEKNEKGIEHTYAPDLTKNNFKRSINNAIKNSFNTNATYTGFLTDRFANKELLGKAKEVMEVVVSTGIEAASEPSAKGGIKLTEVPKPAKTQKDINKNLRTYLASKGQDSKSVWSKDKGEPKPSAAPQAPASETEPEAEVVYMKAADLDSMDSNLQAAFKKIPSDKELSYEQLVKIVKVTIDGKVKGRSLVDGLISAGGLTERVKEKEVGEDEEIKDLELDNDESTPDINRYLSDIQKDFSGFTRKGFGGDLPDY